jgi:hypothetical protein
MHECQKLDLFDLDTKLMTSIGPVYKQQETRSRYCVANDNLCNVRRYCKLLMSQATVVISCFCQILLPSNTGVRATDGTNKSCVSRAT